MKKIIIIILLILGIYYLSEDNYDLSKDAIRFRVIANSNSTIDILIKEKVVNKLSTLLFDKEETKEQTREHIINNISNIQKEIDKIFKSNNYDKTYNISYGLNKFPEKEHNGVKYKAGNYESLVIEIGEGKGNNYWCILYPPLCMKEETNEEKIEFKFKIIEVLKNIF